MKNHDKKIYILKGNIGLIATETVVANKSKFISLIYNIDDEKQVEEIILKVREENRSAKHIVYAYMLKNKGKYTDDKEPQGTAGRPVYKLLEKERIINVLVVVIRYFGGVLLGTGPLMRTYLGVAKEALKKCPKEEYVEYEEKEIVCDYKEELSVINMLKSSNANIKEIIYGENIKIITLIPKK